METTNIYALIDPRNGEVRYIGKANRVDRRYQAHLNKARKHQVHKWNWIQLLKREGLRPIVEVIDEVPMDEWRFWEVYWVSQMKQWGFNLINYTEGGDGCSFANQTSFKKGHKSWLGKNHTEESKRKIGENSHWKNKPAHNRRRVIQKDLNDNIIKVWDYIKQAADETGSLTSKIVLCCKGDRKTHNKFKWEYYE